LGGREKRKVHRFASEGRGETADKAAVGDVQKKPE